MHSRMSTSYIETTYKVKKGEYTGTLLSSLSVMVFTDRDLGTGVDAKKAKEGCGGPKSQVKQGYFICRNACLYIFKKMITQPLRMKFHQLQENG